MNVYTFESIEDMQAAVEKWNSDANAGLAVEQRAITYGDYWVRFYDIGARIVDFGHVMTEAEYVEQETEEGTDPDEIALNLQRLQARHDAGYLYGRAHSILNVTGEWGTTHRSNVWPIEERLYAAAQTVDWKIDQLSPDGKLLLEIAYACYRTHLRMAGGSDS